MQLIKPKLISGEIMTLLEEAEKKVIIVSPYYKISKWYKLHNSFDNLKKRNIPVEFYVREGEWESVAELQAFGYNPLSISKLHAKLYMNEKHAIVSSMNLNISSDTNSLDIALITQTEQEYLEIFEYYTSYIVSKVVSINNAYPKSKNNPDEPVNEQSSYDWVSNLDDRLTSILGKRVFLEFRDDKLHINGRNKYEAFIYSSFRELNISGILSNKEFEFVKSNRGLFSGKRMTIVPVEGGEGFYDTISGVVKNYKSASLHNLHPDESPDIVNMISEFVSSVEQLKCMVR